MISVDVQLKRRDFALDVSFESDAGVIGIFGPSGAGKTTLINLICGLESPESGSIIVSNECMFDASRSINVPVHHRRLGIVFQEHRLFPHFSVMGNLRYGARTQNPSTDEVVELLELRPLLHRKIFQLSGGERQRVAIGRALLSNPRILLLDEPLASLDQRLRQQIIPYLRRIHESLSVPMLYVSHELSELLQLTDELLVVEHGVSVGCGPYRDLLHEEHVLSIIHDRGLTNVIEATVMCHHPEEGLSALGIGTKQHTLVAPLAPCDPGGRVSIGIRPWDIALSQHPVEGVSIQNQLRGVVTRCSTHDTRVLVEVDIGEQVIVEISRKSASTMNIAPDQQIVCLMKSHAVRYLSASPVHT